MALTSQWLRCTSIEPGQVATAIEFDVPALRAIFDYGSAAKRGGESLYWNAGGGVATYSFGIDVDARLCRVVLVELRIYGGRIGAWPSRADGVETRSGIPIVDTSIWKKGGVFCDVDDLFALQERGNDLRIELVSSAPTLRISSSPDVEFDIDGVGSLCAVLFRGLEPEILETLRGRYGRE